MVFPRSMPIFIGLALLFVCGSFVPGHRDPEPVKFDRKLEPLFVHADFQAHHYRALPHRVTALVTDSVADEDREYIYAGTDGPGCIYRLNHYASGAQISMRTIAIGLGDLEEFGECEVNRIVVRDLDRDGEMELIAETSQILPRGRPRVYVWSGSLNPILDSFARPAIQSSWGHGLGFLTRPDQQTDSILSTYCGHGEIVQYRLQNNPAPDGYHHETLGWKVVGQLPASGEALDIADLDNDGADDICVATGYSIHNAAIHIYGSVDDCTNGQPKFIINEDRRFGTAKFLIGGLSEHGNRELFVWWCTGLGEGMTELCRYEIANNGTVVRQLLATDETGEGFWPIDGQMAISDWNADGRDEVWFATSGGRLFQYVEGAGLRLVGQFRDGLGPIATGRLAARPCLYVAVQSQVYQLMPSRTADRRIARSGGESRSFSK